jgi:hypothetical protein
MASNETGEALTSRKGTHCLCHEEVVPMNVASARWVNSEVWVLAGDRWHANAVVASLPFAGIASGCACGYGADMESTILRNVHMAINMAHRFVYFVPEAAEEYARLGVTGFGGYFASRVAPMGAVPDEVILATFYNFSERAVSSANIGAVWATTTPVSLQQARFRAVRRALDRVGVDMSTEQTAEARALIDPVVNGLSLAGKPLAAANMSVSVPEDQLVALWQQVTIIREWRGDVHIALLIANDIGPCECMVLQVGTGRFPLGAAQASRQWNEQEWTQAIATLRARGWVDANGAMTPVGIEAREHLELETDRLCAAMWLPIGDVGATRLTELLNPIHAEMVAAGTYAALV